MNIRNLKQDKDAIISCGRGKKLPAKKPFTERQYQQNIHMFTFRNRFYDWHSTKKHILKLLNLSINFHFIFSVFHRWSRTEIHPISPTTPKGFTRFLANAHALTHSSQRFDAHKHLHKVDRYGSILIVLGSIRLALKCLIKSFLFGGRHMFYGYAEVLNPNTGLGISAI